MSEAANNNKYPGAVAISRLWQRIQEVFVKKDGNKVLSDNNFSNEDKQKLDGIEAGANKYVLPAATSEQLGGVKIGSGLGVAADGTISVESAGSVDWEDVQDTPTSLEGYGITDGATKDELEEVRRSVAQAYHYRGQVEYVSDLEQIQDPENGDVWDVEEDGHNYVWNAEEERWDDLGGTWRIEEMTEEDIDVITGYASSKAAFLEMMEKGGDVTLGSSFAFDAQMRITEDTVIDLNGYVIDGEIPKSEKKELFVADGCRLQIKGTGEVNAVYRIATAVNGGEIWIDGGDFDSGDIGFTAVGSGSKIVMNDGYLTAVEGGIGAYEGAEIIMNGGTIEISDNFAIFTNGSENQGGNRITINGGTMIGNIFSPGYEACGVYIANNDIAEINGGEIMANNGCGLLMRAGNVTINDGMIVASGEPGTTGKVADGDFQMGKSAVIYHEKANYPGKAGMSLTINGGTFIGVDHSLEILSNETTPNVSVTGGSFTPDYPET